MATIMDLLASILNPNPGQNRLVAPNANGPNYLTQTGLAPDQLARFHQMSGMGGQAAPATSMPQQMAPDQQQTAAVAPPQAEGGGILSRLFGGGQSDGENQTIQWLQQQGMDPGTATMYAKNKPALQEYLLKRSQGQKPIEIAGKLVDPTDYHVLADFSDKGTTKGRKRDLSPEEVKARGYPEGSYQVDDVTGDVSSVGGQRTQDPTFDREEQVRSKYSADPNTLNYKKVRDSYERVRTAVAAGNGVDDIGVVFGYMKMLDPGSNVMEGERTTAEQAGGKIASLVNTYNRLVDGESLTPDVRQKFLKSAERLYKESAANLKDTNSYYENIAKGWKLDPSHIVQTPEQYDPLGAPDPAVPTPGPAVAAPAGPVAPSAPGAPGAVAPGGVDFSKMPPPEGFSALQWKFVPMEKRHLWLPQQ